MRIIDVVCADATNARSIHTYLDLNKMAMQTDDPKTRVILTAVVGKHTML